MSAMSKSSARGLSGRSPNRLDGRRLYRCATRSRMSAFLLVTKRLEVGGRHLATLFGQQLALGELEEERLVVIRDVDEGDRARRDTLRVDGDVRRLTHARRGKRGRALAFTPLDHQPGARW